MRTYIHTELKNTYGPEADSIIATLNKKLSRNGRNHIRPFPDPASNNRLSVPLHCGYIEICREE